MEHRQLWQFSTAVSAHDWDQDPYMLSLPERTSSSNLFNFPFYSKDSWQLPWPYRGGRWWQHGTLWKLSVGSLSCTFGADTPWASFFFSLRFQFDCSHLGSVSKLPKNLWWRGSFSSKDPWRSGLPLLSQYKKNNQIIAIYVTNYKIRLLCKGVSKSFEKKIHVHNASGLLHNIKRWNPGVS